MDVVTSLTCVKHPNVETVVRCSRCEQPICPKCMVSTPVGMRCRACAQLRRPPQYTLTGRFLWQALGATLALILAGSLIFNLLLPFAGRSLIVAGVLYIAAGYGVAEALSAAANRKRGPRLQLLAVIATIVITQSTLLATHRLNVIALALTAVACAVAWNRLR